MHFTRSKRNAQATHHPPTSFTQVRQRPRRNYVINRRAAENGVKGRGRQAKVAEVYAKMEQVLDAMDGM